ncbi:Six-hairpin glycosidase-like protein [Macrophomina phaseolina]|uniref:Six-hairpin glycosidase-like protein n=1 Tax=Macrophomina phaseolina TaxID=35725 RepID=A0ABQ8FY32_9PEZI|nr:Six-hairpin glycosidase-like protein [Macrophomina phaseolina]
MASTLPTSACMLLAALATAAGAAVTNSSSTTDVYPVKYSLGDSSSTSDFSSSTCVTLTVADPVVTLDYLTEIGGFPFIEVSNVSAVGVQIESRYSEAKASLGLPQADGPWTYSNGLSNTFRVETFDVTSSGRVQSFFIQGGLRWQAIKLLGEGSLTFCGAGIASGNDVRTVESLPGSFESSNNIYNKIWALGVRSTQQSCIASGTAPSTWELTDEGALIRGQSPAQSTLGTVFSNYTLRFSTKIVRGGTGWRTAVGLKGYGQYIVLTSEYPEGTFLNTNKTLLPPNTLVTNFGWSIVNQTTLETGPTIEYPVPFNVKEGVWYEISTAINATGYSVSINGSDPIFVSNQNSLDGWADIRGSSGDKTAGTWGFGPFQDQEAYFTNVVVEASNGTVLYQSDLKTESVLEEYGVAPNTHNVCLDGAKRDRLVWTGDYAHTQRIIGASTNSSEFSTGTLSYALEWQAPNGSSYAGFSGMSAAMGASPEYGTDSAGYAIIDYQFLYLIAFADYYQFSGDHAFLTAHWQQLKTIVSALLPLVDASSNLVTFGSVPGFFFLGAANGTAPSSTFVYALRKAAILASAAGDNSTAASWTATADSIAAAVNSQLWNADLGIYALSLDSFGNYSIADTAMAILADIADSDRAASAIAALDALRSGIGYKTASTIATPANETSLSPNLSGFLLEALLKASLNAPTNSTAAIARAVSVLLDGLWSAMVTDELYATGSSWEYVYGDGRPGLDTYTSHAHPWGGAPTYVLTEYVLGIRAMQPGFREWLFEPSVAVTGVVDVEWVKGRVPVPGGGIEGGWWKVDGGVRVKACGVEGTRGVVRVPGKEEVVVEGVECIDEVL